MFESVDTDSYFEKITQLYKQCQQEIAQSDVDIYSTRTKDIAMAFEIRSKYTSKEEKIKNDCSDELNNEISSYYKKTGVALTNGAEITNSAFPASFSSFYDDIHFSMMGNYIPYEIQFGIYDEKGILTNHSCYIFVLYNSLKEIDNRSINNSIKKWSDKSREELENISKKFNIKYIGC